MRALALLLLAGRALADEPVLEAQEPAPDRAIRAVWRYDGIPVPVFVMSKQRGEELAAEIGACEDTIGRLQLDLGKKTVDGWGPSWWMWLVAGGVLGAGGAFVALRAR